MNAEGRSVQGAILPLCPQPTFSQRVARACLKNATVVAPTGKQGQVCVSDCHCAPESPRGLGVQQPLAVGLGIPQPLSTKHTRSQSRATEQLRARPLPRRHSPPAGQRWLDTNLSSIPSCSLRSLRWIKKEKKGGREAEPEKQGETEGKQKKRKKRKKGHFRKPRNSEQASPDCLFQSRKESMTVN